jgi:hypothetical protein
VSIRNEQGVCVCVYSCVCTLEHRRRNAKNTNLFQGLVQALRGHVKVTCVNQMTPYRHANTTCREEQLVKDALPADEVELDGQAMHVELPEDPTAVEYVPAPQSVQVAVPFKVLYFPATHAAHGPPFGPVDPALQVQLVKAALPAGELELVGQTVHDASVVCPVAVPYLPAQHPHGSVRRHQPALSSGAVLAAL